MRHFFVLEEILKLSIDLPLALFPRFRNFNFKQFFVLILIHSPGSWSCSAIFVWSSSSTSSSTIWYWKVIWLVHTCRKHVSICTFFTNLRDMNMIITIMTRWCSVNDRGFLFPWHWSLLAFLVDSHLTWFLCYISWCHCLSTHFRLTLVNNGFMCTFVLRVLISDFNGLCSSFRKSSRAHSLFESDRLICLFKIFLVWFGHHRHPFA